MNLTVRIHDKEYTNEIAQGVTFAEEYNETLDSGSIRICHVEQIDNLRPYDDVYIYESGYVFDDYIALWRQGGTLHDGDKGIPFYRHLLVDDFAEETVNLDADINPTTTKSGIFSYSIELFSETKGLEVVQLPNISVTQPLNRKKKVDIYTYLKRFVDMYSPKYKTIDRTSNANTKKWKYAKKYSIAPELKEIFGGVYSQDFTLSNPTLKDVLSTLMITKDMIPYVKDNVIYAKAISERVGDPYVIETEKNSGRINMVVGQMSSADYCDGVRRQYSNALSQNGICHFIEFLGFRNKDNAIMTLDNMCVESTHSFYKIKKMKMCYYKRANVVGSDGNGNELNDNIYFLCKQDITPLVKLRSEWEVLSQDWRKLKTSDVDNIPKDINDLSKYKISTITYDLGGNVISGWGNRYTEYKENFLSVFDITHTFIENIFHFVDIHNPLGEITLQELKEYYKNEVAQNTDLDIETFTINPAVPETKVFTNILTHVYSPDDEVDDVLKFKTFFFEIEYEGFYNGALIHSRDKGNDNFFQNDNQSSSLTLLEKDGYSQKEKLNRFANKTITMKGRLDGENYGVGNLLKLGQTGAIGNDDDVIIYRREYSIFDNYILASYAGVQDYVLKNFYTSVYARYRTNQLMSYGESTTRAETRKVMLLLSKNKKFKDEEDTFLKIENDNTEVTNKLLFSAFQPNQENKAINNGLILLNGKDSYFVDLQTFTSGNSLCFNIAMTDNASGGNFIESWVAPYKLLLASPSDNENYYVGSTQEWYNIVDDEETGAIKSMGFELSHVDRKPKLVVKKGNETNANNVYNYSQSLPKKTNFIAEDISNNIIINAENLFKDNKEIIDMTIQIEPISYDNNNIVFSEYFMKLSDLFSYNKYDEDFVLKPGETSFNDKNEIDFIESGVDNKYEIKLNKSEGDELIERINSLSLKAIPFSVAFKCPIRGTTDEAPRFFEFKSTTATTYQTFKEYDAEGNPTYIDNIRLLGEGKYYVSNNNWEELTQLDFAFRDENTGGFERNIYSYHTFEFYVEGEFSKTRVATEFAETSKSSIIQRNMFVEYNTESYIDKTYAYQILPSTQEQEIFKDSEGNFYSVSSTFDLGGGEGEDSFIEIDIPSSIKASVKSVRYWYFDYDAAYSKDYTNSEYMLDYHPDQSGYHFVFGVNLTDSDRTNNDKLKIYITKTTHRDERVFDSVGRQIGSAHNYAGGDFDNMYQRYDETDNYKDFDTISAGTVDVMPPAAGTVEGAEGMYYKGENATFTFIPNRGYAIDRWKDSNGETLSTEETITLPISLTQGISVECLRLYVNIYNNPSGHVLAYGDNQGLVFVPLFSVKHGVHSVSSLKIKFKMGGVSQEHTISEGETIELAEGISFLANSFSVIQAPVGAGSVASLLYNLTSENDNPIVSITSIEIYDANEPIGEVEGGDDNEEETEYVSIYNNLSGAALTYGESKDVGFSPSISMTLGEYSVSSLKIRFKIDDISQEHALTEGETIVLTEGISFLANKMQVISLSEIGGVGILASLTYDLLSASNSQPQVIITAISILKDSQPIDNNNSGGGSSSGGGTGGGGFLPDIPDIA